jgi:hypothetical protein
MVILFTGCAVSKLQPRETELAAMKQKVSGISLAEAQSGFQIYKTSCSGCHHLYKPDAYTISRWEKILPEMMSRAKLSSEKDIRFLKNYLFAKSK